MNWHDIFEYKDGLLIRRIRVANVSRVGDVAGRVDKNGYVIVKYRQKAYRAHRVIWEMFNGEIPSKMQVDHLNHNRSDNRIENLRIVTNQGNCKNRSMGVRNSTGVLGVSFCKREGKYLAQARVDGKTKFIGYFHSLDLAAKARDEFCKLNGFHENHGSDYSDYMG